MADEVKRGGAVWGALGRVNLVLAVLSAYSLLNGVLADFRPSLARLSMVFRWAVEGYRDVRDWAFGWVVDLVAWLGIVIEIPWYVADGLVGIGLVFAAVNFESLQRDQRTILAAFLDLNRSPMFKFADTYLGELGSILALGGLGSLVWVFTSNLQLALLVGLAYALVFLWINYSLPTWLDDWLPDPDDCLPDTVQGVLVLPPLLAGAPLVVSRRTIALTLAAVLALNVLNVAFLYVIDPVVACPPDLLWELIAPFSKDPKPCHVLPT